MSRIKNILTINGNGELFGSDLQEKLISGEAGIPVDYKAHIQGSMLRRMSKVVKNGVALSFKLKETFEGEFSKISVATGLGCLKDTIKFEDNNLANPEGLISPTSFIQSTHNTIAGQIGLLHKNNGTNLTFVQSGMSFETALLNSEIGIEEGESILLGSSEATIPFFEELTNLFDNETCELSDMATFMILSNEDSGIQVEHPKFFHFQDKQRDLSFMNLDDKALILYGRSDIEKSNVDLDIRISINFNKYSGRYMTNNSFGIHLAHNMLENGNRIKGSSDIDEVYVVNNFQDKAFSLTKLSK